MMYVTLTTKKHCSVVGGGEGSKWTKSKSLVLAFNVVMHNNKTLGKTMQIIAFCASHHTYSSSIMI